MKKVEVTGGKLAALSLIVIEKVLERNAMYQDAWQRQGICGVLTRLCDKLIRIENQQGKEVVIQGEDTNNDLIDAIGYSLLGLLYLEEKEKEKISQWHSNLPIADCNCWDCQQMEKSNEITRKAFEKSDEIIRFEKEYADAIIGKAMLDEDAAIMETAHVNLQDKDWFNQYGCGCKHCRQMIIEAAKRRDK